MLTKPLSTAPLPVKAHDAIPDYALARVELLAMMESAGLTIEIDRIAKRTDGGLGNDDKWNREAGHVRARFYLRPKHVLHTMEYSAGVGNLIPRTFEGFKSAFEVGRKLTRFPSWPKPDLRAAFQLSQRLAMGAKRMTLHEESESMPVIEAVKAAWLPAPVDLLQCLLSDSTDESFESWCDSFGIVWSTCKAHAAWKACRESDRVARMIFGRDYDIARDIAQRF